MNFTKKQTLLFSFFFLITSFIQLTAQPVTFSNNQSMTMFGAGTPALYPSEIEVTGMPQYLHEITVRWDMTTVNGIYGLDMLLEAPDGQQLMLISDINLNYGGGLDDINIGTTGEEKANFFNLWPGEVYLPANYTNIQTQVDDFPAPGPGVFDQPDPDIFNLLDINPNGTWKLYVQNDFLNQTVINITGWKLVLEGGDAPACRKVGFPEEVTINDWDATVKWAPGDGNTLWDVYLTDDSFNDIPNDASAPTFDDVTDNDNFFIPDLQPGYEYAVYVRPDCGNGNTGKWRGPLIFETGFHPCDYAIPLPDVCEIFDPGDLPWFDAELVVPAGLKKWILEFTPPADGDYWMTFTEANNYVTTWMQRVDTCQFDGFEQNEIITDYYQVNKMNNLKQDEKYWILMSQANGFTGIPPIYISPCPAPPLKVWNPNAFADSVQVEWLSVNVIPYQDEFEFYYGETPLAAPDTNTTPTQTGIYIPDNFQTTIEGLTHSTDYELYARTRCHTDSVSCWQGPFSIPTLTPCTFVEWLGVNDSATSWADFTFTWTGDNPTDYWAFQVCDPGVHPDTSDCHGPILHTQMGDTVNYLIGTIDLSTPKQLWIQASCIGNQPWQGPFDLPANETPPVPVQDITCNENVPNLFQGLFDNNHLYISNPCFNSNDSQDENLYRFTSSVTGTVQLLKGAIGGDSNFSRAAFFMKSASLLPDGNNWDYVGCWAVGASNDPLEMQVEQDSAYYILSDYRGISGGQFEFRIFGCDNTCPAVDQIDITDSDLTTVDLSWNEPIAGATYLLKYEPQHFLQTAIEIPDHPNTFITLNGLDAVAPYQVQIRTLCPDDTKSDWYAEDILTGQNTTMEEGELTRCNPRFIPTGSTTSIGFSYEMLSLQVVQDGAYFLASDFDEFYIYENNFDAAQPDNNLVGGVFASSNPQYPIRKDTTLNLQTGTQYWLVATGQTVTENYSQGSLAVHFWADGPAEPVFGQPLFEGREAAVHGSVIDYPVWEIPDDEFICPDTSGWVHFYRHGPDPVNHTDDVLMFSMENFPALEASHQFTRLGVGDAPGASLITNPPADYVQNPSGWYVMNRFWNYPVEQASYQPDQPIKVRFYYTENDFLDVQNAIALAGGTLNSHEDLFFYKINGINDVQVLAPQNSHPGVPAANAFDDALGYWEYSNGMEATSDTWLHGTYNNAHYAEMLIRWFSGGGGGMAVNGMGATTPVSVSEGLAKEDWPLVFPNPFNGFININKANNSLAEIEQIQLMDGLGRAVVSLNDAAEANHLEVGLLPVGIYLLVVKTSEGEAVYRMVR